MKLKYSIFTLMTTFLLALTVQAQSVFNEVSYSPKQTTFKLNAPKNLYCVYTTQEGVAMQ